MFFYVVGSMVLGLHIIGYGYCNGSFFALMVGFGLALLCFVVGAIDHEVYREQKLIKSVLAMVACVVAIVIYSSMFESYYPDFVVSESELDLGWKYGVLQYSIRGFLLLMFIVVTLLNVLCICCPMHECTMSDPLDVHSRVGNNVQKVNNSQKSFAHSVKKKFTKSIKKKK